MLKYVNFCTLRRCRKTFPLNALLVGCRFVWGGGEDRAKISSIINWADNVGHCIEIQKLTFQAKPFASSDDKGLMLAGNINC